MKALVFSPNVQLQRAICQALGDRGHEVRVLLTDAPDRTMVWPSHVEPYLGRRGDPATLSDAIQGCRALILVDPFATGRRPEVLDEEEAAHAREADATAVALYDTATQMDIPRVIRLAPGTLAERGELPHPPPGEWLTIRTTTPIYGTGNDSLTLFLLMMRALPAVPMLSDAHVWQPIWYRDMAEALAASVERPASSLNRIIDVAGPETLTQQEIYERIARLIDRRPMRIPVPTFLASYGGRLAEALHTSAPFEAYASDLFEEDDYQPAPTDVLSTFFGVKPTILEEGLRQLVRELDEVVPSHGVGRLEVKRFSAAIHGSRLRATDLLRAFRQRFKDVMPVEVGVEPISPDVELIQGAVLTMSMPGRGHVTVRVEDVTTHQVVLATLRGHAMAGIVRFSAHHAGDVVRFEVMTCDTAGSRLDWIALALGGTRLQDANWTKVVENVVELSGGRAEGIESDSHKLTREEADQMDRWIDALIHHQRSVEQAQAT